MPDGFPNAPISIPQLRLDGIKASILEINTVALRMEERGQVMISDDTLFLID